LISQWQSVGGLGRTTRAYKARKEQELAHEQIMARLASGLSAKGLPAGVSKTDTGKFQARITLSGKRINLGSFDTAEEAGEVYQNARRSGFTSADSPKKNKRGTGLLSLATQTH
jgi:hypothetical protein